MLTSSWFGCHAAPLLFRSLQKGPSLYFLTRFEGWPTFSRTEGVEVTQLPKPVSFASLKHTTKPADRLLSIDWIARELQYSSRYIGQIQGCQQLSSHSLCLVKNLATQPSTRSQRTASLSGTKLTKQSPWLSPWALTGALQDCCTLADLRRRLQQQQGELNSFHFNAAWGTLLRLSRESREGMLVPKREDMVELAQWLAVITMAMGYDLNDRAVCNIFHNLGALELRPDNGLFSWLLARMTANGGQVLREDIPQGLSNAAWALSQMGLLTAQERQALGLIAQVALGKLHDGEGDEFDPQTISNLVSAFATVHASQAESRGHGPTMTGEGDMYSKLIELLDHLAAAALIKLPGFEPQNLSNTAWAYAKLGHLHPELMHALMLQANLTRFNPQNLTILLWALATLGCPMPDGFLLAWKTAATKALPRFDAQDTASSLVSLAKLGWKPRRNDEFMRAWEKAALLGLPRFNCRDLVNSLWALAKLCWCEPALVTDLAHHTNKLLNQFNTQDLASTLWALAVLQHRDTHLVSALLDAMHCKLGECNNQGLANTLWAVTVLDHRERPLVTQAVLQQLAARHSVTLTVEDCTQVWQAACSLAGEQGPLLQDSGVQRLIRRCEMRAKVDIMASRSSPSPAKQHVAAALRAMVKESGKQLKVVENLQHPVTHQLVDIVLLRPDDGAWVEVVEVDGDHRFAVNQEGRPLGALVLRDRLLRGQGVNVVTVAWWHSKMGNVELKQRLAENLGWGAARR